MKGDGEAGGASQASGASTALVPQLREICGAGNVITDPLELRTYECDGLTSHRSVPALAVLPGTAEETAAVVASCAAAGVPFVARGSGTGLSGGALPREDGVLIVMSRMRTVIEIDPVSRRAVVEPGVTNLSVSKAAAPFGLFYAPDPSSQVVCSVGGNVAENSGGAHCLKHGFTVHHVTGLQIVTPAGELDWLGDGTGVTTGYDLLGAFTGSEGTLGIVTKIIVKLMPLPEVVHTLLAAYATTSEGGRAVSDIIGAGIVPAAIEMMDALSIEAAEAAVQCNYPAGAGAVLIVELDGPASEVEAELATVRSLCEKAGATEIRAADDPAQRAVIWAGRKSAFAAVGRISPSFIVQDGVVPRTSLGAVLARIAALSEEAGIRVANVFHAGDGNLHPLVLYDDAVPGQEAAAEEVSGAILDACLEQGGSITGEHGVGIDKSRYMPKMFGADDLDTMQLVRCAFDPASLCNPGKIFPTPRLCGEVPGHRRAPHPAVAAGQAEIFLMETERAMVPAVRDELVAACPVVREGGPQDAIAGVVASFIASPASTDEASELLRVAAAHDLAVVPRGAGTGLGWGAPPARCDLIIDLQAMDQVIEHAAGDLVARVQAGTTIGHLASVLAAAGQQLALDAPADATVGGVVATGTAGPRRFRYGAPRDLLIGITVVRADGVVAHSGGKVVKNVAGYDLGKLFAGSQGTLGVITEVTFRLHPLPAAVAWITGDFGPADLAGAASAVASAAGSALVPSAVELDWSGGSPPGPRVLRLGVLLEGTPSGVAERARQMSELLESAGANLTAALSKVPFRWWETVPEAGSPSTVVRVTFWVRRLGEVFDALAAAGASAGVRPAVSGPAGAGLLYACLDPLTEPDAAARFVRELRDRLSGGQEGSGGQGGSGGWRPRDPGGSGRASGFVPPGLALPRGSVTVLAAPPPVLAAAGAYGAVPGAALMRAIKDQFDPGHRMFPGRMTGGS